MSRILAIDYGEKRVGLAVSDPLKLIATPLDTLKVSSEKALFEDLLKLIEKWDIHQILVGYPLGLKGNKTQQTQKVDQFVAALKKYVPLPIILWDERFTSTEAETILHQKGVKPSKNKDLIDQMSARIILQEYLDYGMKDEK
ncbi:MAG: Holliday junction resolvase RuvX [Candidatus Marinimicrobia bacterium]|nr:Holliday junction resolvase RuvX [Candidatus Neomarinimicrobiota bacterium]MDD5581793.1 Holliday junction resolvase RuvX [Candidatus Neomarinimicrobiota bacterium]